MFTGVDRISRSTAADRLRRQAESHCRYSQTLHDGRRRGRDWSSPVAGRDELSSRAVMLVVAYRAFFGAPAAQAP